MLWVSGPLLQAETHHALYIAILLPYHCVDVVMVGTNYVFIIVYSNFPLFYCGLNVYFHVAMSEINSYYYYYHGKTYTMICPKNYLLLNCVVNVLFLLQSFMSL